MEIQNLFTQKWMESYVRIEIQKFMEFQLEIKFALHFASLCIF